MEKGRSRHEEAFGHATIFGGVATYYDDIV